jgi:hypothetical protein
MIGNSLSSSYPNVEWVPQKEIRLPDFNYVLSKVHLDEILNSIIRPGQSGDRKLAKRSSGGS